MNRSTKIAVLLAATWAVLSLTPAVAAETVTVSRELEFAEGSGVSSNVESECTLQTRLPQFIKSSSKGVNVVLTDEIGSASGRVLHLEITNVVGPGGGAWSGSKSVTVRGKLTEDGEVIGSFIASRYSGGGAFAGFKGTCSILGRCIKAIGADIAKWLRRPTMDARLGNA